MSSRKDNRTLKSRRMITHLNAIRQKELANVFDNLNINDNASSSEPPQKLPNYKTFVGKPKKRKKKAPKAAKEPPPAKTPIDDDWTPPDRNDDTTHPDFGPPFMVYEITPSKISTFSNINDPRLQALPHRIQRPIREIIRGLPALTMKPDWVPQEETPLWASLQIQQQQQQGTRPRPRRRQVTLPVTITPIQHTSDIPNHLTSAQHQAIATALKGHEPDEPTDLHSSKDYFEKRLYKALRAYPTLRHAYSSSRLTKPHYDVLFPNYFWEKVKISSAQHNHKTTKKQKKGKGIDVANDNDDDPSKHAWSDLQNSVTPIPRKNLLDLHKGQSVDDASKMILQFKDRQLLKHICITDHLPLAIDHPFTFALVLAPLYNSDDGPNAHWFLLERLPNKCFTHFCSFGTDPLNNSYYQFEISPNTRLELGRHVHGPHFHDQFQHPSTAMCLQYCVLYILHKIYNKTVDYASIFELKPIHHNKESLSSDPSLLTNDKNIHKAFVNIFHH